MLFALAVMLPLFGNIKSSQLTSDFTDRALYDFPKGFLWGAASAAQHIEHQQPSDWTAFEKRVIAEGKTQTDPRPGYALPGHINALDQVSEQVRQRKTNFDELIEEDFALAHELGHNSHRFSISWARLFPQENMREPDPAGIAFYQRVLTAMKDNGITPLVSFFHFSTPEWFWHDLNGKRGWERSDALLHFKQFVEAVLDNFGTQIKNWCELCPSSCARAKSSSINSSKLVFL